MGAARREPRRGEIPVEQVRSLPSDDFPFPGVLRTNVGIARRMVMSAIRRATELFVPNYYIWSANYLFF